MPLTPLKKEIMYSTYICQLGSSIQIEHLIDPNPSTLPPAPRQISMPIDTMTQLQYLDLDLFPFSLGNGRDQLSS